MYKLNDTRELLQAYRDADLSREEFEGPRYTRLTRLRELLDAGAIGEGLRWQEARTG